MPSRVSNSGHMQVEVRQKLISIYPDVSTAAGPVQWCPTEFRLTFDVRFVCNEQLDEGQVSLLGCQVKSCPAVVVIGVHVTPAIQQ